MVVNVKEVRAHFAEYIARAEQGEEIVITRKGQAVARLVPPKPHAMFQRRFRRWHQCGQVGCLGCKKRL